LGLQILGEDGLPQLDEAGNVQPLSQPSIPARPTAIAATAGGGTVKIYGDNLVRFSQVKLAMGQLKFAVLKAVGKTICDEISILPGGIAEQSLQTILNHLEINYGTPSEADLAELMASLSQPFSSDNNFRQEFAKLAIKFEKLRIFQVALNNFQKMSYLEAATASLLNVGEAIRRYKLTYPAFTSRSFTAMVEYIRISLQSSLRMPINYVNMVTEINTSEHVSDNSHSSVHATSSTTLTKAQIIEIVQGVLEQVGSTSRSIAPITTNTKNVNIQRQGRGDGRGGRGRGRGQGVAGPQQNTTVANYCFVHGSNSHTGSKCRVMNQDSSYTHAVKMTSAL
jgi:hypothetical protein